MGTTEAGGLRARGRRRLEITERDRWQPTPAVVAPKRTPSPSRLEVVPVESIAAPSDVFACEALAAKLTAGACVRRQELAHGGVEGIGRGPIDTRRAANEMAVCARCPVGEQVAGRLAELRGRT